ncbi:OmpH family outer membrane protein [Erythrobacter sp. YJ-T3-07]|uniref:OmpH family outer membrane protein n=1 Tax=Erythrobacter sp. YJ-T3-07 TaxID=2793063 RepID=UPI0018D42AE7|nr:OmpH family outer membrane protein [Erythrobacter sp. YJ-T3-07]MBH1943913.1 OmpH family outer membrane protein [Erythrobacter sp. YJ-T3-07]
MKLAKAILAGATILGATLATVPAAAQVNGIAISNPEAVILQSAARQAAYQQISQQYQAQIQQINTIRQESSQLERSLDTNSDNQVSDAEIQANPTVVAQLQQKEQQIAQIYQPIQLAQAYAIEQLVADYQNAQNQVIQQKKIQMLLSPDVVQYAPDSANVTEDILKVLDQRMPTVQTAPPANWQPSRQTVALQQRVQQIMLGLAQQQAMQAAQQQGQQQQAPAQPSGR